ncbi:hypothetical protein HanRHA438_Chr02g0064911 [Helianthus annuus]|uniref:Uncharacterized protein n=1 Tax=Helianthus annuus TaxID=4232 RepID=A0A251VH91_HELAN|nr:hypothetical protein HanRHA438_Chr02g0064911 [Helianthus annuus]
MLLKPSKFQEHKTKSFYIPFGYDHSLGYTLPNRTPTPSFRLPAASKNPIRPPPLRSPSSPMRHTL